MVLIKGEVKLEAGGNGSSRWVEGEGWEGEGKKKAEA
jgi:hypothetical protein